MTRSKLERARPGDVLLHNLLSRLLVDWLMAARTQPAATCAGSVLTACLGMSPLKLWRCACYPLPTTCGLRRWCGCTSAWHQRHAWPCALTRRATRPSTCQATPPRPGPRAPVFPGPRKSPGVRWQHQFDTCRIGCWNAPRRASRSDNRRALHPTSRCQRSDGARVAGLWRARQFRHCQACDWPYSPPSTGLASAATARVGSPGER
ncbi:uncharacterized protein V1510DRAFT_161540 [Dipodascopsis tothii]|uniref:uncharacterized protein n=1 Tax=Dipodascopsis tothii TaxID=44089 RepID=UPI0034CFB570